MWVFHSAVMRKIKVKWLSGRVCSVIVVNEHGSNMLNPGTSMNTLFHMYASGTKKNFILKFPCYIARDKYL